MRITVRNSYLIGVVGIALGLASIAQTYKIRNLNQKVAMHERELETVRDRISKLKKQVSQLKIEKAYYLRDLELINPELIKAIIAVESSGNPNAYNTHSGAVGLMQLKPIIYNKLCGLTKEEAFIPEKNIACGTMFLRHLLDKFGGNIEKTLLFYNNGYKIRNRKYYTKVINQLTKQISNDTLIVD